MQAFKLLNSSQPVGLRQRVSCNYREERADGPATPTTGLSPSARLPRIESVRTERGEKENAERLKDDRIMWRDFKMQSSAKTLASQ